MSIWPPKTSPMPRTCWRMWSIMHVIEKRIRAIIAEGHVRLAETLAERIAAACFEDPRVRTARVRVEKLHALTDAESVGVEIERTALIYCAAMTSAHNRAMIRHAPAEGRRAHRRLSQDPARRAGRLSHAECGGRCALCRQGQEPEEARLRPMPAAACIATASPAWWPRRRRCCSSPPRRKPKRCCWNPT